MPVFLSKLDQWPISERADKRRLGGPDDGVLAEYLCLNEEEVVRIPDHSMRLESPFRPIHALTPVLSSE